MTAEQVRQAGLDKFYTIPSVSEKCLDIISSRYKWSEWELVIEPSAGNGSFFLNIPTDNKLGIDISPEHPDIIKQDFLTYEPREINGRILVVGNPPFGHVSSLAIKFFNHASKWADVIAFIVPRTFRRISIHNKLNLDFHLVFDEDIPLSPCSFDPPMMAKCCFQIWEKLEKKRKIIKIETYHNDFEFKQTEDGADFCLRAYGSNCGEIAQTAKCPKNWHWIKSNIGKDTLIDRFKSLDYRISLETARQNSLGKSDLVMLYNNRFPRISPADWLGFVFYSVGGEVVMW